MLLTIDIGNTNITLGVFEIISGRAVKGPVKIWRLASDKSRTSDEYGTKILDLFRYALLETSIVKGIAVASVVPVLNGVFEEVAKSYFRIEPFFVVPGNTKMIKILYENPKEVGADRIADAVAAYSFFGGPCVVVDFGTATTFDCINKKGDYLGGVIASGPLISAQSLSERTAKLPHVEIVLPKKTIGKTTIQSIQSGLFFGCIGLVKEILSNIKKEMPENPKIIATGGLAGLIAPKIKEVKHIVPELTLEGIRILWDRASRYLRDTTLVDSVDKHVDKSKKGLKSVLKRVQIVDS